MSTVHGYDQSLCIHDGKTILNSIYMHLSLVGKEVGKFYSWGGNIVSLLQDGIGQVDICKSSHEYINSRHFLFILL